MDFHIVSSDDTRPADKRYVSRFIRKFGPIFGLAIFLPFLLFFAINPPDFNFTPQAGKKELRVWLEPQSVATSPGVPITLKVIASNDDENLAIHSLNVKFSPKPGLAITPMALSYSPPFSGKVTVGEVTVSSSISGTYTVDILKDQITSSVPDLNIFVSSANVIVAQ